MEGDPDWYYEIGEFWWSARGKEKYTLAGTLPGGTIAGAEKVLAKRSLPWIPKDLASMIIGRELPVDTPGERCLVPVVCSEEAARAIRLAGYQPKVTAKLRQRIRYRFRKWHALKPVSKMTSSGDYEIDLRQLTKDLIMVVDIRRQVHSG